jgi:hypothetical protein
MSQAFTKAAFEFNWTPNTLQQKTPPSYGVVSQWRKVMCMYGTRLSFWWLFWCVSLLYDILIDFFFLLNSASNAYISISCTDNFLNQITLLYSLRIQIELLVWYLWVTPNALFLFHFLACNISIALYVADKEVWNQIKVAILPLCITIWIYDIITRNNLSLLLCNWQWCCTVDSQQLFWFNCVTVDPQCSVNLVF